MESDQPEQFDLLATQRRILRVVRRSHRFLMWHIFSTVFGMYIVMLWVILVIAMMGLPLQLLSIAFIIIIIPILIAPMQYRSAKQRFGALHAAGAALDEMEEAVNQNQIVTGLTSYIFLIFDVLRPETLGSISTDNETEDLRKQLGDLTRKVVMEIVFQAVLFTFLIVNFLIPEFMSTITEGGPLFFPLLFLVVIFAILIARWFIFIYWRLLVRRWLKFYNRFIVWAQEIEHIFFYSDENQDGGFQSE